MPGPNRGPIYFERPVLKDAVTALDAAGWRVHIHAIGDRAVRVALDGYEAARQANGDSGNRHTIAHLQLVDPADCRGSPSSACCRACSSSGQSATPYTMEALKRYIGKERWSRIYPSGSLLDGRCDGHRRQRLARRPQRPFDAIQQAVTRQGPFGGKYEPPLNPDQGVPLMDAIAMHTNGTAFQLHQERIHGFDHGGQGRRCDRARPGSTGGPDRSGPRHAGRSGRSSGARPSIRSTRRRRRCADS